ncbi:MAG: hypothetical protein ABSG68_18095 [Thermoguttaceae bacterium]|jgi:hypothetical protein
MRVIPFVKVSADIQRHLPNPIPLDEDLLELLHQMRRIVAERIVEAWLKTAELPGGLSAEGLRHEFKKARPGVHVPRSIFHRIYEVRP